LIIVSAFILPGIFFTAFKVLVFYFQLQFVCHRKERKKVLSFSVVSQRDLFVPCWDLFSVVQDPTFFLRRMQLLWKKMSLIQAVARKVVSVQDRAVGVD
jgi:hypothetical protein